jgi:hypothetical protein
MAKRKYQKMTAEEIALRDEHQRVARERIVERRQIERRMEEEAGRTAAEE